MCGRHTISAVARPSDWRSANQLRSSDESTDLIGRLEALGADPLIVAGYVRLLRAIFDGVPRDLKKKELLKDRQAGP